MCHVAGLYLGGTHPMMSMTWLLESDPAIRWQVMRDLTDEPGGVVAAERSRVAREGWGAQLLALQTPDGHWGGSDDRGWLATIYTLVLLRELGVDPASEPVRSAIDLIRERITWQQLDGRPFFDGETEPCINGAILATGAYFGVASERLVERLLSEQLDDGGWNCEAPKSKRTSFHTTICVLEGLLEYEKLQGATAEVTRSRLRGHDYLLERRMHRSLASGQVIDRDWTRFSFPTTWHYDVLRGLDYLRSAGVEPDERVADAIDLVDKARDENGRWPLQGFHFERVSFDMEEGVGQASRWNTLRALRVLDWYGK
jgi:hypothetical protein